MTEESTIQPYEEMSAAERFERTPRPFKFVRVRFERGGQADYIRKLLEDERDDLMLDLADARIDGKDEMSEDIGNLRRDLGYLNRAIMDISNGMIELAGGD
jgi:hypothetical protein